jgi:transcription elongation factor GreA
MEKFPITAQGFAKMEAELRQRKSVDRPAIIEAISEARAHGDLSENAEYHAAKEKQGFNEGFIKDLEDKISRAEIIDPKTLSGNVVKFGATVTLVDEDTDEEKTYQIVGEYEADLDKGGISIVSPLARALIGKKLGDSIEVNTPKGTKGYEIVKIEYR